MCRTEGMILAVVERPFFDEVIAAFEHFAVGRGGFGRGRLKVMFQTTLWFGFVLTQQTYWVCFNIFPRINLNRFVEYIP